MVLRFRAAPTTPFSFGKAAFQAFTAARATSAYLRLLDVMAFLSPTHTSTPSTRSFSFV
jgi:hypothetical protein